MLIHCCWWRTRGRLWTNGSIQGRFTGVSPDKQQVTLVCRAEGRTHMLSNGKVWTGLFTSWGYDISKKTHREKTRSGRKNNMQDETFLGTSLNINHQKYQPIVRVRFHHQPAQSGVNKEDHFNTGWRKRLSRCTSCGTKLCNSKVEPGWSLPHKADVWTLWLLRCIQSTALTMRPVQLYLSWVC